MLEIGSLVDGKYKILNEVGHGGMSIVYLAMNEKANKQWAIKEVRKDGVKDFEVVKQSLVAETDMLKKLSHPCLPDIVDVIEDDDRFLIVMDYIQGNSLSKALDEFGAQPQDEVIRWAKQLCDVLGYLHSQNPPIIYRDMKPANIMLKPDGNVALIDFGTAREFKEKNIADTTCLGTMGYAAPEQFGGMGQTDPRTDIYCLGATLYHLVTGMSPCEPPYEISPIRQINPALSGGLESIILKCTQPNPMNRYQNAAELMYALEHYDEIDDIFKRKQKKKLGLFITSSYEDLNNMLISDFVLDKDEAQILSKIQVGLDNTGSDGYSHTYDVMSQLKKSNPDGYEQVCYMFGESFLFYYDINVEKDRYANAAKWYKEAVNKYPVAKIYCDISDCLDLISQYGEAKIKQTEKMYEEYGQLWSKISDLEKESEEFDSVDSKLQVWNEIDDILNNNISPLLEVTSKQDMIELLQRVSQNSGNIDKSIIKDDIDNLQHNIEQTIDKIDTIKEEK